MIIGERIRFRAVEREDLPTLLVWINDPDVYSRLGVYLPLSMQDEQDWFEEGRKRPPEEHNLVIEITQPGQDSATTAWKMIGGTGFFNLNNRNHCAELGIMIGDKSAWNQGYGTEAVRLLVKHGFNTLNLNRIYLRVLENNPGAIRAYEKAGFTHEGRLRQSEYRDGRYSDLLVMSILKEEFV
jgi:diamine N-acetyltransferase